MKLLFISDEHIGANRNPSSRVLKNIKETINNIEDLGALDGIINLGDSSDMLLSTRSIEYRDYIDLHLWLSELSNSLGIPYVYLYGTPIHEMDQFANVEHIIRRAYPGLDLRVYRGVGIDDLFGHTFLYASDEAINDNAVYETEVTKLLQEHGVDRVDFAITHAVYDSHITLPLPSVRSVKFIESKTRYNVFNGHIHTHTINGKLITVGSVDRLAFNEEEKKGIGLYTHNDHFTHYEFIENVNAMKFITLNGPMSLNKLKTTLRRYNDEYDIAYIRIGASVGLSPFMVNELSAEYDNLVLQAETRNKTKHGSSELALSEVKKIEITPDTVLPLLKERVTIGGMDELVNKYISLLK